MRKNSASTNNRVLPHKSLVRILPPALNKVIKINKFKNVKDLINYSKGGIFSKVLEKNKTSDITLFCMAKDTEISEHTASKDGFIFVVEGKGIFNLDGEDISMTEGTMIFMKKNAKHSLKAFKNTTFILVLSEA